MMKRKGNDNNGLFLIGLIILLSNCSSKNYIVNQFYCDSLLPIKDTSFFFYAKTSNGSVTEEIKPVDSVYYSSSVKLNGMNLKFNINKFKRYTLYTESDTIHKTVKRKFYIIYSYLTKDSVKYGFRVNDIDYYILQQNGGFGGVSIDYQLINLPKEILVEPFFEVNGVKTIDSLNKVRILNGNCIYSKSM